MRFTRSTLLQGLVPAGIVAVAAVVTTSMGWRDDPAGGVRSPVTVGSDYYVFVPLVELNEKRSDGLEWDTGSSSAPDIFVEVLWRGHRVFESSTKDDTFVAKWSQSELNVRELAVGRKTSLEDTLKAARINIQTGDQIEFRIFDEDLLGLSDPAGVLTLDATALNVGESTYTVENQGVKRIVLRVIPLNETPELLK